MIVYTAVFGGYDTLKNSPGVPGVDYVCFTDRAQTATGWRYVVQPEPSPVWGARARKILSHKFLPDEEYSLWVDANLLFVGDPHTTVKNFLAEHDVAVFGHPTRHCIYEEAAICITQGKGDPDQIIPQTIRYRERGYPPGNGLAETGVLLRRHSSAIVEFNREWWGEVVTGSLRDQISFPYIAWLLGIEYALFPGELSKGVAVEYDNQHRPYVEETHD